MNCPKRSGFISSLSFHPHNLLLQLKSVMRFTIVSVLCSMFSFFLLSANVCSSTEWSQNLAVSSCSLPLILLHISFQWNRLAYDDHMWSCHYQIHFPRSFQMHSTARAAKGLTAATVDQSCSSWQSLYANRQVWPHFPCHVVRLVFLPYSIL